MRFKKCINECELKHAYNGLGKKMEKDMIEETILINKANAKKKAWK